MNDSTQGLNATLGPIANLLAQSGPTLIQNRPLRKMIVKRLKDQLFEDLKQKRQEGSPIPGVDDDKTAFGLSIIDTLDRALEGRYFSDKAIHTIFDIVAKDLFLKQGENTRAADRFRTDTGNNAPTFLVISPGKACNLQCTGCYANAGILTNEKLSWEIFDRIITEAKTLWGVRFFVISGGEPMAYRSEGKDLLDMAEKHNDCLFLMFTNGALINEKAIERLARVGNLTPAFSLEGWRERTDARRGKGVFDKVLAGMDRLRKAGVPFGMSLTATCENTEEILSDEFMDFFYKEQGVIYSWIFHYMPIGRSVSLDLMPTPQQRLWMWHQSWKLIREKRYFLADFWNHGTVCDGCLSAGSDTGGGYFYIDWNGTVSPCVFMPYSPININDAYRDGKTLNEVWQDPFFASLRNWQRSYKQKNGNWLMPCPIRDHHADLRKMIAIHKPEPSDESAREALLDPDYADGMDRYDQAYQSLSDIVWQEHYLRAADPKDDQIADLPDISNLLEKQELFSASDLGYGEQQIAERVGNHMAVRRAFVLGGGGARGALQVGALRALLESGWRPDLLVGTSVGAMNATCLALNGLNPKGLAALEGAWEDASKSCLLNPNHSWLTLRALLNHPDGHAILRLRAFFRAHGATSSLRFADIPDVQLAMVAADLNTGCPVIYGTDPDHSVLEGLFASTALPPWVMPLENDEKYLVDGGALSNLPVEPALRLGATEIVALDLTDPACVSDTGPQANRFFNKLFYAVCQRQSELEIALARSHGVLVHQILLRSPASTPIWDFSAYSELIACGYKITRQELSRWEPPQESWPETLKQMVGVQR